MSKAPPPLLGFNNNVRHRGRIFHIQTEDSGVRFPRIVTHLFADGGRIVKTARTDYSQHLQLSDMATVVRGMMKAQHKAMFASLRAGDLDPLLEDVCGPLDPVKEQRVSVVELTSQNDLETARVVVASSKASVQEPSVPPAISERAVNIARPAPTASAVVGAQPVLAAREDTPAPASVRPPRKSRPPIPQRSSRPGPTAATTDAAVVRPQARPAPAPQARLAPAPQARLAPAPQARPAPAPQARPAPAPRTNTRSLFGDGAISEQSLDEVILSYLAEDLEEPK